MTGLIASFILLLLSIGGMALGHAFRGHKRSKSCHMDSSCKAAKDCRNALTVKDLGAKQ